MGWGGALAWSFGVELAGTTSRLLWFLVWGAFWRGSMERLWAAGWVWPSGDDLFRGFREEIIQMISHR